MTITSIDQKSSRLSPGLLAWMGLIGILLIIGLISAFYVFSNGLVVTNIETIQTQCYTQQL